KKDLQEFGRKTDAIVAQVGFQIKADLIEKLENCKVICTFGMGFNHVDLGASNAHNIAVCNVPDYCTEEVADHTLTLSLSLLRRLFTYHKKVRSGIWDPTEVEPIKRLSETTIGLLGFGKIARKV